MRYTMLAALVTVGSLVASGSSPLSSSPSPADSLFTSFGLVALFVGCWKARLFRS